jgi:integrase
VFPRLGQTAVIDLDTPAVRRFVAELTVAGVSPGNLLGVRAVLRLVLNTAVEAGALSVNPCSGVKVPRPKRPEMHFLTPEQVEDLTQAITHPITKRAGNGAAPNWRTDLPEFGLLVCFAAYTGMRAGEIAGLRVGRVDFLRSTVEVSESITEVNGRLVAGPTKNYQRRTVPFPPFLRDDLAAHLHGKQVDPSDFFFTAPEGGPLRHNNFYRRHFKPAITRLSCRRQSGSMIMPTRALCRLVTNTRLKLG